jgi:hypothetical protein
VAARLAAWLDAESVSIGHRESQTEEIFMAGPSPHFPRPTDAELDAWWDRLKDLPWDDPDERQRVSHGRNNDRIRRCIMRHDFAGTLGFIASSASSEVRDVAGRLLGFARGLMPDGGQDESDVSPEDTIVDDEDPSAEPPLDTAP